MCVYCCNRDPALLGVLCILANYMRYISLKNPINTDGEPVYFHNFGGCAGFWKISTSNDQWYSAAQLANLWPQYSSQTTGGTSPPSPPALIESQPNYRKHNPLICISNDRETAYFLSNGCAWFLALIAIISDNMLHNLPVQGLEFVCNALQNWGVTQTTRGTYFSSSWALMLESQPTSKALCFPHQPTDQMVHVKHGWIKNCRRYIFLVVKIHQAGSGLWVTKHITALNFIL